MARRQRPYVPGMAALVTLTFALGGWWNGLSRLSDNSFFLHLRTGRWILDHGIPREDFYSFTAPGRRWVAQSWLAELLYGALDEAFGPFSIRLLGAATGAVVAALTYRLALRCCGDRARALVVAVAAVLASLTLWSPRPLFLGVLAMVALLWAVEVPGSWFGRRPIVAVPVLMWLWANLHGTFALGFVYLGLHLAGRWLDGARPWEGREGDLLRATAVAVVACALNPYGPALLLFPLDLLSRGDILQRVTEWQSPQLRTIQGATFGLWLITFIVCLARGRRPSRRDLLVSLPFLMLGFWAQRNIALAPLVGLPVLSRAIAPERPPAEDRPQEMLNRVVAAFLVLLGLGWTVQAAGMPDYDVSGYPVRAMRFLDREGLTGGRLVTTDLWGGYVILRSWPEQKVFMDDRYDMYPTDFTEDYLKLNDGAAGWDEVLDRYGAEVVLWPRDAVLTRLIGTGPAWRRVYADDDSVVYVRR